jgi:hypothetical protein
MTVVSLIFVGAHGYCQPGKRSHLSITPGVDFSRMQAQDRRGTRVEFPDRAQFRIGALLEFPIATGKWAIIFEPTLQRYTTHRPLPLTYRSLEVPLGARRYFSVRKNMGLYVNAAAVGDIVLEHSMQFASNYSFHAGKFKVNFAVGAGLAVRRFTIEYRYYTQRTRMDYTGSFTYNHNKRSVIVGFRLY